MGRSTTKSPEHVSNKINNQERDNTPPYSRIFIVCNKGVSEELLKKAFSVFGKIDYCKMIRDKQTDDSKGLCYIKYTKASAAAEAIEAMDGKKLNEVTGAVGENENNSNGRSSVLRVQIAEAKGSRKKQYSKEPEDTPARSRLFVVCPREMTESILNETFHKIPGLEYCKIITDKATGESKGFAYVKYNKASSAALAMEEISEKGEIGNMKVKVLIADPKVKRVNTSSYPLGHPDYIDENSSLNELYYYPPQQLPPGYYHPSYYHDPNNPAPPMLFTPAGPFMFYNSPYYPSPQQPSFCVTCPKSLSEEQLTTFLSDCYPHFEYCSLDVDANGESKGVARIYFQDAVSTAIAFEKFNGFEIPEYGTVTCLAEQNPIPAPLNYPSPAFYSPYYPLTPPEMAMYNTPVKITYSSTTPIPEHILSELFGGFGLFKFISNEKENSSGIVQYDNWGCGMMALRYLDQYTVCNTKLSLRIENSANEHPMITSVPFTRLQ